MQLQGLGIAKPQAERHSSSHMAVHLPSVVHSKMQLWYCYYAILAHCAADGGKGGYLEVLINEDVVWLDVAVDDGRREGVQVSHALRCACSYLHHLQEGEGAWREGEGKRA